HLLQGLLEEEEGRAAVLLAQVGLDLAALRAAVASLDNPHASGAEASPLLLSSATNQVFQLAGQIARHLDPDRTVASDPLLLALVQADEDLRRQLEKFGLSPAHLEAEVLSIKGPPVQLEEPLVLDETREEIDLARILDASANRAREALRVVEDYCRFVLDDTFLSGELKRLRHDLAETLSALSPTMLLEARETLRDVGTGISTTQEQERYSLRGVVQANLKRLEEALRSLEEFGKLHSATLGQALEKLRYRTYTVERAIFLGTSTRQRLAEARLYVLLTGSQCTAALDWTIEEAAAGGVQVFQLREKDLEDRALLERAHKVRQWTKRAGVLFLLNDRPDLARLAEADGVHLGQEDLPVKEARRILGPGALVGVSTHNLEQVRQAILDGADYLGVGPTFPSGTKDFPEFSGLEFVRQVAAETTLPAFVIGGVNLKNLPEVVAAGGRRVAVSQALCQADDPRQVAAAMRRILELGDTRGERNPGQQLW
ncbi:MAG: thiamine phosphate synthase, partial [Planctomycetes bacterium]|nr:thiamine phosphate synthase [Planctomycetota bacterium]